MSDEYAQFMTEIITILNNCNDKQTATRIIRDKLRVSIEVKQIDSDDLFVVAPGIDSTQLVWKH